MSSHGHSCPSVMIICLQPQTWNAASRVICLLPIASAFKKNFFFLNIILYYANVYIFIYVYVNCNTIIERKSFLFFWSNWDGACEEDDIFHRHANTHEAYTL